MENNKETVEINEENIQKALNYLKLDINPFSKRDNLEKSIEEEKPKEEAKEKEKEKEKESEDKKEESEEKQPDKPIEEKTKKEDIIEKTEIKKSLEEIAENLKPFDDTLQKSILNKVETLEKSVLEKSVLERLEETTEKLQKAEEINLQLNETIISLQKSIGEGFNTLIDKFKAVGELEQRHLEAIQKQNERIANIDSTPVRRSITSKDFVQKSFDEEKDNKENSNKLSISKNRKDIIKILRQKSKIDEVDDLKKANGDYLTALQSYEASNTLTKAIREDLLKSENIEIIG